MALKDFIANRTATITVATDDDLSDAVDVPGGATSALIHVPTLTSSTVSVTVSMDGTTFATLYNVDESVQGFPTASTGARMMPIIFFGWVKQMKIATGTGQAADRTFTISFVR